MKWTDVYDIAADLAEKHEDIDPLAVNFVSLSAYVMALDGFDDEPERCGEKVLEAIQAAWIEELD